jgi:phosphatidylserine/phosphatidylglycerophosphate/cardiolipin synthase-like enzyme
VRLVLDAHRSDGNAATAQALIAAGGECRVAGGRAHEAHGKLLVCDDAVSVGTGNLIWRDAPRDRRLRFPPEATLLAGTREWWVTAAGASRLLATARRAFDAQWRAAAPPPSRWSAGAASAVPRVGTPTPQVAPMGARVSSRALDLVIGGAAVATALRTMIPAARRRVLVTVPYVRAVAPPVRDLLALLAVATAAGVECGLLLGAVPPSADAEVLARLPFPVRSMDPSRSTSGHAKGLVADGAVLVSSANWSSSGLGANWEAALHIRDAAAAAYYAAAWRRDWDTATPLDV